jgi:PAS domain S-box-containing protein
MRDSRGFLWFATRDGLSRFDGIRFVTYQVGKRDAPPGIEHSFETSKGIYWIVTTGGLYRYDPNAVTLRPQDNNSGRPVLNAEYINDGRGAIYEDKDGRVWFVGYTGLSLIEEKDGRVLFHNVELNVPDRPKIFGITDFRQARDGSFWIVTTAGIMRRLPDGRDIFYGVENPRTDLFATVLEDNSGRIWLTRSSGIYVLKPENLSELADLGRLTVRKLNAIAQLKTGAQPPLPDQPGDLFKFTSIEGFVSNSTEFSYKTADGHLWFSNREGVIEFDGQNFHAYTSEKSFAGDNARMVEDADGNLWLGGTRNLVRFNRSGLTTYDSADGFKTSGILAVGASRDGKLYAASNDFNVIQFDGKTFQSFRPAIPAHARALWNSDMARLDSKNDWWFLTSEKLYRFASANDLAALQKQKPLAVYDERDGLQASSTYRSFEDRQGDIWISNRAAPDADDSKFGLSKFNRATQRFHAFSAAENYPSRKSAAAFAEDATGNLWIGFYEGGLVRYSGGRFTEIKDGLPEGFITDLHFDKKGRLWLSTAFNGLSRVDDLNAQVLNFVTYKTDNGMASNNVRSIAEDHLGQIYAGTARGVDRISPDTDRIKHYSTSDGLAGDFVSSAFCDSDGVLWFGTPNGLSRLVPQQDRKTVAPTIWLGELRIAGESQVVSDLGVAEIANLELAPAQNNLQIDFFGLDFSPNRSLRYQYMLEGGDKDWSVPTELRTVNFSNLSAGSYRFLVRAINADGLTSVKPAVVSFKLLPPIWQRWWFILAVAILLAGSVITLDRFRVWKTRQVKVALKQTTESETRYRTLAETASDAIITIDGNSKIVYANEAVEHVFGYRVDEIIGESLTKLMPQHFRALHEAGLSRYISTNTKHIGWMAVDLPGRHKSGAEVPLEISFGEFEKDGNRFFTGIARDITERKVAEAALAKSREERFRELERVRKRIATDLHDDIGSSLTKISLLSEVINQRAGTRDGEITQPLSMIAGTSRELVDSMSDIVWAINPQKDHLSDLTGRMHRFAADVLTAGNIKFTWHAPDLENDVSVGANVRREIFLTFKECINNMVKHSHCSEAHLEVRINSVSLEVHLRDNGKGFDTSDETDGHGLLSIRERAAALGGHLKIQSASGKGTRIRMKVPLDQNSRDGHVVG